MASRRSLSALFLVCTRSAQLERLGRARIALAACGLATLGFGGCAQNPQQLAAASHGKEYFPSSVYGHISPRVVADGQPIPRGGGQYLVGKPYTVAGQTYYPSERRIVQIGNASWYGDAFHGRLTANGEIYDRDGLTAAHPTMPLPSYARVTNLRNNYSMIVRVNDRGPYASDRIMDVSRRVAEALEFKRYGTARIKVEYVGRASLAGSDDAKLMATLRTDGPARWGEGEPTMIAESRPPARVASLAPYVPAERPLPVTDEPPRRDRAAPVIVRASRPAPEPPPRFGARPEAVEAAYHRYGIVRDASPPPPFRSYGRAVPMPVRERFAMARPVEPRWHDEPRPVRLAARDDAPHLPIRDLLPPPRYDRGYGEPVRSSRAIAHAIMPPMRPSAYAAGSAPRHRLVEARTERYRGD